MYETVFQRYEKKYLITAEQYAELRGRFAGRLESDRYGEYRIFSIYYDTAGFDLARASARKPLYKEKLRLRSYGKAGPGAPVFLELKKKFRGVVYKRRARLSAEGAGFSAENLAFLARGPVEADGPEAQVLAEIRQFMGRYPDLAPRAFLAYDRTAFSGLEDEGLRLTFDTRIRFRDTDLRLDKEGWGREILESGGVLLEVKTPGAVPLWLCRALSDCGAFPRSFSKYGSCYERFLRGNAGGLCGAAEAGGGDGVIFQDNAFEGVHFYDSEWRECTSA